MPTVRTYRRAVAWCATALLAWMMCSPAAAQNQPDRTPERPVNPFAELRGSASAGTAPLEGAVDPQAYLVGPGDVFSIYIGGSQPVTLSQVVSADGRLVLPEVPGLPVAGRPLAEVHDAAVAALRERFRNVTLDVALVQPRQFYVHVAGAVPTPGRFVATPLARVSTVLAQAFADSTARPVDNPAFRPSLRAITIRHRDGSNESVDLRRYFATGAPQHDPYLRDGDVVSVPAYNLKREAIFVDGAVAFPGAYPYRSGDTVLDVLAVATGAESPTSVRSARLTRITSDGERLTETLDVASMHDGSTPPLPLTPLDHIYVPEPANERGVVTVTGAVEQPGTYPISDGKTTLQDLMQFVDLRPDALARGAYLERSPLRAEVATATEQRSRTVGRNGMLHTVRADSAAALRATRLSDFDFNTRAFLHQEMRLQNRVSLDLPAVVNGTTDPVVLRDGDRLVVPHDEQTVYVFGQVTRPGYVPFQPDWQGDDYLAAVGGLGEKAAKAYVIQAGTGRYIRLDDADIQSGDMIFVNRKEAMANTMEMQRLVIDKQRQEATERSDRIRYVLQAFSAIASVVTAYVAVRRL